MRARLLAKVLAAVLIPWALRRKPDFAVYGGSDSPNMLRWFILPRNRWFNIYLHQMIGDDSDRGLHDHPYDNLSLILAGGYWEHCPKSWPDYEWFPYQYIFWRAPGQIITRSAARPHRLTLPNSKLSSFSLFLTGPRRREWGFWVQREHWEPGLPTLRWGPFTEFTEESNYGRSKKVQP